MTWNSNVTPTETLKMAGSSAHKRIQGDFRTLRTHFGATLPMGDFLKINCEDGQEDYGHPYIYRHSKHLTCSNVTTGVYRAYIGRT